MPTHDTPEATLAAALQYVCAKNGWRILGRPDDPVLHSYEEFVAALLAAMRDWTLVANDTLGEDNLTIHLLENKVEQLREAYDAAQTARGLEYERALAAEAQIARWKRLQSAHHRMLRVTAATCDACKHERAPL